MKKKLWRCDSFSNEISQIIQNDKNLRENNMVLTRSKLKAATDSNFSAIFNNNKYNIFKKDKAVVDVESYWETEEVSHAYKKSKSTFLFTVFSVLIMKFFSNI